MMFSPSRIKQLSIEDPFILLNRCKLLFLSLALVFFWYAAINSSMTVGESLLWKKVEKAQVHLANWRIKQGLESPIEVDPWQTGLIGIEWSAITTTLGDLEAKRSSTHPSWAVQISRWFKKLELKLGDPIVIYSSGSFPGMLLNTLVAAEDLELDVFLIVSLGASSWGANHPDASWPVIASELRKFGFIKKRADYYTLGGGSEIGRGMIDEGRKILEQASRNSSVTLLKAKNLKEMIALKTKHLYEHKPKLFINIGGSHANLGSDEEILKLSPGLLSPSVSYPAGNGNISSALNKQIPVIHLLNLKALSQRIGIPYNTKPRPISPSTSGFFWYGIGLFLFFFVIGTYKRWKLR